jgi:hypothetical protein
LRPLIGAGEGKKRAGIEAGAKFSPATVSSEEETVGGEEADWWGLHGSEGERGSWVPVREEVGWAAGSFLCWAETVPLALLSFSFLLFFFCFSYLFYIICKFDSNQAKPNS